MVRKGAPIKIGAIVIIADENLPKRCWPKGKVIDTVVAADGQVRRVSVKTQFGVLHRPATKVAVLNVGEDHEQARMSDSLTGGGNVTAVHKGLIKPKQLFNFLLYSVQQTGLCIIVVSLICMYSK